jgi:hypothetical protein
MGLFSVTRRGPVGDCPGPCCGKPEILVLPTGLGLPRHSSRTGGGYRPLKAEFFRRVTQKLEEDGILLLTDVVREEDESLPVYLRRYCDWLRSDWSALGAEEKASICDHILNNDRPETFSVLKALAQAAGLGDATAVARYGWHRVICFRRPAEDKSTDLAIH